MQSRQKSFSGRDSYFSSNVKFFTTKPGANKIRILPPTWADAKHYGSDIWVHYGIGPDNVGYLCLNRMSGEACPLCEAKQEADHNNDEDLSKALRATRRVAVYLIDRGAESEGPKVWAMPQTVDKEICAQAWDKETGEVYALDHPDEGYDISFEVEGAAQLKKYVGIRLARRESPLSDDDKQAVAWLEYITEHPLTDELVVHDYDTLKQAFEGKPSARKDDQDSDKPAAKTRPGILKKSAKPAEETEEETTQEKESAAEEHKARPKIGAAKKPEVKKPVTKKKGPTWEEIHELDEDGLGELADKESIDFGDQEFPSVEACQDFVCEALGIENPADEYGTQSAEEEQEEEAPAKKSGSLADRLRNMGKKK